MTTRIYVNLTDEQMDYLTGNRVTVTPSAYNTLKEAVLAQRPRPITIGDRVYIGDGRFEIGTVEVIKDCHAWVWKNGSPWGSYSVRDLTRVE